MHFFVSLTTKCNLQCTYCYGKSVDCFGEWTDDFDVLPTEPVWSVDDLKQFISKDPEPTIMLYGGEPLLKMGKIREMIEKIPARYILQTNGLLLRNLEKKYLDKIHCIQLSIDGGKNITDAQRGKGVYETVIDDARWLKGMGWKGETVARMTVTEQADIFKEASHLLDTELFDSIHWQIDALFGTDYEKRNFKEWVEKGYNPDIRKLVEFWIERMEKGKVEKLYPFIGIASSFLNNERFNYPRCGAGWKHYAIMTDGNIYPCPVMGGMKKFIVGNLNDNPNKLPVVELSEPCRSCQILSKCGGRCLYANKTQFWVEKGFDEVCSTVKDIIQAIEGVVPEINSLLSNGTISRSQFSYEKFNSCEIIP